MKWNSKRIANTFGMDARARLYIEYASEEELRESLPLLAGERVLHVGAGSNLLFTRDWDGVALHSAILGKQLVGEDASGVLVRVGGGETWDNVVDWAIAQGYSGLENLSLIPGEMGAAAVQNIGAYGVELAEWVDCVEAIDLLTGASRVFSRSECAYGYRSSVFKGELRGCYAITHVVLHLDKDFHPRLEYGGLSHCFEGRPCTPAALREAVVGFRRTKLPDPAILGNAGSFFVNPIISEEAFNRLQAQHGSLPHYRQEGGVKVPAGWLIEQCGWKGRRMGRAAVHERQALVLVNLGGATGEEIVQLANAIKESVRARFAIDLHAEVNIL